MQLFSVDQQRSQALEAHAASFASFRVCIHSLDSFACFVSVLKLYEFGSLGQVAGNDKDSILISFASKTSNAGQVASKLHVIELGAQLGEYMFGLSILFSYSCF